MKKIYIIFALILAIPLMAYVWHQTHTKQIFQEEQELMATMIQEERQAAYLQLMRNSVKRINQNINFYLGDNISDYRERGYLFNPESKNLDTTDKAQILYSLLLHYKDNTVLELGEREVNILDNLELRYKSSGDAIRYYEYPISKDFARWISLAKKNSKEPDINPMYVYFAKAIKGKKIRIKK